LLSDEEEVGPKVQEDQEDPFPRQLGEEPGVAAVVCDEAAGITGKWKEGPQY